MFQKFFLQQMSQQRKVKISENMLMGIREYCSDTKNHNLIHKQRLSFRHKTAYFVRLSNIPKYNKNLQQNSTQIKINWIKMGCSSSIETLDHPSKQWTESPVGLLSVTIVSFSLTGTHNFLFSKQIPHAKITVSNQTFCTKKNIQAQADQQTSIDQTFQFVINSCYQANGRSLDCQVWSDSFFTGGRIGHGKFDLNNIINNQLSNEVVCPLYQGAESRGNVKLKIGFTSYPYDNLSFKIINALVIHKRDEDLTKRRIFVRIEVGEQIIETKPSAETPKILPHWENEIINFRIPTFCETGKITVYKSTKDADLQIGSFDVDMPNLLQTRIQRMFDEIFSAFVDGKQEVRGTLKFYTLKGSSHFIEPPSPRKEKRLSRNPEQLYHVPVQSDFKKIESENIEMESKKVERQQIKNKLMSPLPALKKRKTNMECGITLHKVEVENPEP